MTAGLWSHVRVRRVIGFNVPLMHADTIMHGLQAITPTNLRCEQDLGVDVGTKELGEKTTREDCQH